MLEQSGGAERRPGSSKPTPPALLSGALGPSQVVFYCLGSLVLPGGGEGCVT